MSNDIFEDAVITPLRFVTCMVCADGLHGEQRAVCDKPLCIATARYQIAEAKLEMATTTASQLSDDVRDLRRDLTEVRRTLWMAVKASGGKIEIGYDIAVDATADVTIAMTPNPAAKSWMLEAK